MIFRGVWVEEQAFMEAGQSIFDTYTFRIVAIFCIFYTVRRFVLFVYNLIAAFFAKIGRILSLFMGTSRRLLLAVIGVFIIFWTGYIVGSFSCGCNPLQLLFTF